MQELTDTQSAVFKPYRKNYNNLDLLTSFSGRTRYGSVLIFINHYRKQQQSLSRLFRHRYHGKIVSGITANSYRVSRQILYTYNDGFASKLFISPFITWRIGSDLSPLVLLPYISRVSNSLSSSVSVFLSSMLAAYLSLS